MRDTQEANGAMRALVRLLGAGRASTDQARDIAQLRTATDTRGLIGQASGLMMERHGITSDQALSDLIRQSQDRNIKVREIAAQLVAVANADAAAHAAGVQNRGGQRLT